MGLGRLISSSIIHTDLHKPNNKLVNAQLEHFGARTNHGQTRIHKTHHDPNLGEATTFPLQYTLYLTMGPAPKCHFVEGFQSGSLKIPKVGTLATLGAHNFAFRPLIEMKSRAKLQFSLRTFQWYVANHLTLKKLGRFLTFSGRESNCQFDSRPFFWP